MKKEIDLRKRCAESDKICAYIKIDYRPIDDWNELMPAVQKVADDILGLHDGSYCDADTLYEHGFVNILYKDVPYVRNIVCNTIDWIGKQKRTEMKTNEENNKLIAEFMGFPIDNSDNPNNPLYLIGHEYNTEYQATYLIEMKFHNSWDWLMPVVQKCYKIEDEEGFDNLVDAVSTLDMYSTYNAVVEFIKQQKKQ